MYSDAWLKQAPPARRKALGFTLIAVGCGMLYWALRA